MGDDQIYGGADNDLPRADDGRDSVSGGDGNDGINDGAGNDGLAGDAGNDRIDGGLGADTIRGGSGDDTLNGDEGDDGLFEGTGADDVHFVPGGGKDTVMDFRMDQFDEFYVSNGLGLDAAGILAAAAQSGTDVVFDPGAEGTVTLRNITLAAVENSSFVRD